ncbi:MAG: hypothetical protein QXM08_05340 [Thermofilaceae archaeon]
MIVVYRDASSGRVVVDLKDRGLSIDLEDHEATYLMKKLADELGYRVILRRAQIHMRREAGGMIRVWIREGKVLRTVLVPVEVVSAYVEALSSLQVQRISKQELAELVVPRLAGKYRELSRFLVNGALNWEMFFGSRETYYTFFYVPLLVIEQSKAIKCYNKYVRILDQALLLKRR